MDHDKLYKRINDGYFSGADLKNPYHERPTRKAREEILEKLHATFVGTLNEIKAEEMRLLEEYEKKRKANQTEHYNILAARKQEFFDALGTIYDVKEHKNFDKLCSLAWEKGHSAGFSEVMSEFQDLVDLLK